MKVLLRLVALCVAAVWFLTLAHFSALAYQGALTPLVKSGAPGALGVVSWLVTICAGPFAAVQLFRLKASGRKLTLLLCGVALAYHLTGVTFWRTPETPLEPIFEALVWNGLLLGLLLSPAAKRAT